MRNRYLKFISILSHIFSERFGVYWWCGELQEKNSSKDNLIHVLLATHQLVAPILYKIPYLTIRKYLSFVVRYGIFKFKSKPELNSNLFFSYYGNYFSCLYKMEDSSVLILPQKTDWKKVYKDKDVICIDQFLRLKHFYQVPISYFKVVIRFVLNYSCLKFCIKELGKTILNREDAWTLFKGQVLKSFAGQLLVENLFLQKIFEELNLQNPKKLIYIYEGLGWEKLLCHIFKDQKKVGVLCTLPSDNMTNFWYKEDEVELMPKPDHLCVIGKNSLERFEKIYGERVHLLGTTRHQYLLDVEEGEGNEVLVILGYNDEQSKELLEWVEAAYDKYIVKPHPKSNLDGINFIYEDLYSCLKRADTVVIASDSMASFEAMAMGIDVIIPRLNSFADLNPLPLGYQLGVNSSWLSDFFYFASNEEMINEIITL